VIKFIHIKDFQSHKDSFIEFSSSTTAIVGLNNLGKSAILKALRKLVRNEPNSNSFVRNIPEETKVTSISVQIEDENTGLSNSVERRVGRNLSYSPDNMYKLTSSTGENYEFTKFHKTGIPEEVIKSLGISIPQVFGDIEFDLNFHIQKDEDFLVRGKGLSSIRSKILSRITGVDIAQRAIQLGKLKEKNLNQDIDKIRVQRKVWKLELEKYSELDSIIILVNQKVNEIKELTILENTIIYYKKAVDKLQTILSNAVAAKDLVKTLSVDINVTNINREYELILKLYKLRDIIGLKEVSQKAILILQNNVNIEELKTVFIIKSLVHKLFSCKNQLEKVIQITKVQNVDMSSITEVKDRLSIYLSYQQKITDLTTTMYNKESEIESINNDYNSVEEELLNCRKEIRICPFWDKECPIWESKFKEN